MLKKSLLLAAVMIGGASVGVIGAQHFQSTADPMANLPPEVQFMHHACAPGAEGQSLTSHIPEPLAKELALTSTQQTEIDRLATEACSQMVRAHESILNLLTPEQRAKVKELHGGDHGPEGIHAKMRRLLHGGN